MQVKSNLDNYPEEYNILPCKIILLENGKKDMKFLFPWEKYQHEKYPRDSLSKYNNSDFFVVCGQISNNLVVLDFDIDKTKEVNSEELYGKIIEIEPRFKEALTIRTQSGGPHVHVEVESMDCYNMLNRNKDIPCKLDEIDHIDVQGEGKIAIIYPSQKYEIINQEKPLKITNSEFFEILSKFTKKEEKTLETPKKDKKVTKSTKQKPEKDSKNIRSPFKEIISKELKVLDLCDETGQPEHLYWKGLIFEYFHRGRYTIDEILDLLEGVDHFDREKTLKQLSYKKHHPEGSYIKDEIEVKNQPFSEITLQKMFPNYDPNQERKKLWEMYEIQTGKQATYPGKDGARFSTKDYVRWEAKRKGDMSDETVKRQEEQIAEELIDGFDLLVLDDTKQILVRKNVAYLLETRDFDDELKRKIFRIESGSYSNEKWDILAMIKDDKRVRIKRDEFCTDIYFIPYKNGVYDFKTDCFLKVNQVKSLKFFYEISYDYKEDKEYKCNNFKKLLVQWIDEKTTPYHRKGNRKVLLNDHFEALGLTMSMNTGFKKHFILLGDTDGGKTQHRQIRISFYDKWSMSATTLQRIGKNQFGTDNLQFKVCLDVDELPASVIFNIGPVKNLLGGGGKMQGELKGGKKFDFDPYVKGWFNANYPPELKNPNDKALYNRFIFFLFPNVFTQDNESYKNQISKDIINDPDEMQGILHEAIKGYKRVLERKGLRKELSKNTRHIWLMGSDPLYKFLYNYTNKDTSYHGKITTEDFLEKFAIYGKEVWSPQKIYLRLNQYGIAKYMSDKVQKLRGVQWKKGVWDDEENNDSSEVKKEIIKIEQTIMDQHMHKVSFTPEEKEILQNVRDDLKQLGVSKEINQLFVSSGAQSEGLSFDEFRTLVSKDLALKFMKYEDGLEYVELIKEGDF